MSSNLPINQRDITAPTPQNTPLTHAPIAAGLSRPTVPDITEEGGDENEDSDSAQQAGAMKKVLAKFVQDKLKELVGRTSGYIESLSPDIKRSLVAMHAVQEQQTELHAQFKREVWELERKYLDLAKPLYERRNALISGAAAPTAEEIEKGEVVAAKVDGDYTPLPKEENPKPTVIDEFWLTALRNHLGIQELISDRDAGALKHLIDIRLSYLPATEENPGYKLTFVFSPNDYFENEVLEKTYLYQKEIDYSGNFMYERAIGTKILWKDDKDLTKEFEIKKQRNKNTNRTRLVRKAHPVESFFNFFSPPTPPPENAIDNDDLDEDELEDIENRLEMDYQIGEDLKERVIPHAVDYFTGKALEYDAEDYQDSDDDFEDEEEGFSDEDDDDDDEEEEEDIPAPRRGAGKGRGAGAAGQSVNPEECKQQ